MILFVREADRRLVSGVDQGRKTVRAHGTAHREEAYR